MGTKKKLQVETGVSSVHGVVVAVSYIADAQVVSEDRARIVNLAPDSSDPEYGGDTCPGSAWDEECGAILKSVREALPAGWAAEWSDDDIVIDRRH